MISFYLDSSIFVDDTISSFCNGCSSFPWVFWVSSLNKYVLFALGMLTSHFAENLLNISRDGSETVEGLTDWVIEYT